METMPSSFSLLISHLCPGLVLPSPVQDDENDDGDEGRIRSGTK